MQKIVFWQNIPSMHQAALIRSTASASGAATVLVAEDDLPKWRSDSGWHTPDFGAATVHVRPDADVRRRLMYETDAETVHIFSGITAYASTREALGVVTAATRGSRALAVVMLESWDHRGVYGRLRGLKYLRLARQWQSRVDGVLAIGIRGADQYSHAGFARRRVFPFGYFLPWEPVLSDPNVRGDGVAEHRLIFVGQMIRRKGVDVLLEAMARIDSFAWRVDMVGDGPELRQYQALAHDLGLGNRLTWHGSLPNAQARSLMAQADVLVLPSHYDGWGAVVNEALGCGTKVVVSDAVGAATVIRDSSQGEVFETGDPAALATSIRRTVAGGPRSHEDRVRLREWADDAIGAQAGGQYLVAVLRHLQGAGERPHPPWCGPTASPTG
jgi:glycosyltransferase involved in cell wall biosynthesis